MPFLKDNNVTKPNHGKDFSGIKEVSLEISEGKTTMIGRSGIGHQLWLNLHQPLEKL